MAHWSAGRVLRRRSLALAVALCCTAAAQLLPRRVMAQTSGGRQPIPAPPLESAIALPATTLLDGATLAESPWQGKLLIVVMWASWCPFCKKLLPMLDKLRAEHRAKGLEVLALTLDRKPADAQQAMRERGYQFPAGLFDERWRTAIGQPKGLPVVWVIGRDRRLKMLGPVDL